LEKKEKGDEKARKEGIKQELCSITKSARKPRSMGK
jgi:hypothetical protein